YEIGQWMEFRRVMVRSEGEDGPRRLQLDPTHEQVLFDRQVVVVKGIALVHSLGKQFRVLAQHLGQVLPILCRVVPIFAILCFTRSEERRVGKGGSAGR